MKTLHTQSDFRAWVMVNAWPKVLDLLQSKGKQYTGESESVFANFEGGSEIAQDTKEHYLFTQASKQWYVVSDWSKRGTLEEAEIREVVQRLLDILVYVLLLLYMLQTKQEDS